MFVQHLFQLLVLMLHVDFTHGRMTAILYRRQIFQGLSVGPLHDVITTNTRGTNVHKCHKIATGRRKWNAKTMNGFDDVGSPPRHLGGTLEDNFEPTWSGGLLDCSMFELE